MTVTVEASEIRGIWQWAVIDVTDPRQPTEIASSSALFGSERQALAHAEETMLAMDRHFTRRRIARASRSTSASPEAVGNRPPGKP